MDNTQFDYTTFVDSMEYEAQVYGIIDAFEERCLQAILLDPAFKNADSNLVKLAASPNDVLHNHEKSLVRNLKQRKNPVKASSVTEANMLGFVTDKAAEAFASLKSLYKVKNLLENQQANTQFKLAYEIFGMFHLYLPILKSSALQEEGLKNDKKTEKHTKLMDLKPFWLQHAATYKRQHPNAKQSELAYEISDYLEKTYGLKYEASTLKNKFTMTEIPKAS